MNAEPRHEIDPQHFRRVMGRFATGVTVITATDGGHTRGMTANAFMSGSLDPPLCVVSVAKRAHMHDHLLAAGRFAVNMLAAGQESIAIHYAGQPVPGLDVALGNADGIPVIADTAATITAATTAHHDCGDHTIFIGHIATMESNNRPPLLYHASRFAALIPLREEAPAIPEFW